MDNRDYMETMVALFATASKDKRVAFLNGVLFGIGLACLPHINWDMLKDAIEKGDAVWLLRIEQDCFEINKKVTQNEIALVEAMLKSGDNP